MVADSLALATDAAKQLKVEWQAVQQTPEKRLKAIKRPLIRLLLSLASHTCIRTMGMAGRVACAGAIT